jgi:single-stranded-DNA-specific exonuclease
VVTAIGADIVPITGENRVLAYLGLQVINENPRPGIQALGASLKKKEWTISDVVFVIAPRINAAGRMKHGAYAVEILLEKNVESVQNQATAIETYNSNRKELDRSITQEALTQLDELKEENRMTTVVYQKDWHKGVIGIVASRLIETHYRPTVVFTQSGDVLAASARSVKGFDLYNALEACSEHLLQFGGHKYAAGMTLLPDQYEHFKAKFEQVVSETIEPDMLIQQVAIDCELSLDQITSKFYRILKQFAPFGPGNMTPVFATHNVVDTGYAKRVGKDETHLRITAVQEKGKPITGIGFGLGDRLPLVANQSIFSMAYSIDENEWNNRVSLQLKLKDIQ